MGCAFGKDSDGFASCHCYGIDRQSSSYAKVPFRSPLMEQMPLAFKSALIQLLVVLGLSVDGCESLSLRLDPWVAAHGCFPHYA